MTEVTPVEIQDKLDGIEYPASKQQLINYAENHGENNEGVIEVLDQIPDKTYNSPIDVSQALSDII